MSVGGLVLIAVNIITVVKSVSINLLQNRNLLREQKKHKILRKTKEKEKKLRELQNRQLTKKKTRKIPMYQKKNLPRKRYTEEE